MKTYLSKYIRPDQDISKAINSVIESAKDGTTLMFPSGRFPLLSTIHQHNKTIHWEADDVVLEIFNPLPAVEITRNQPTDKAHISGITLLNRHGTEPNAEQKGFDISVPVIMENCKILNFQGNGLTLSADVVSSPGSDVSNSKLQSILIAGCKGHGLFLQGGDANQINIYHVDIRDCLGVGFYDHSFLGNQFYGCMAHNNGINYKADDGNNRTGFWGCYSEGGKSPDHLAGYSMWMGGINTSGVALYEQAVAYTGKNISSANIQSLEVQEIRLNREGVTNGLRFHQIGEGFPHYVMDHFNRIYEVFGAKEDAPATYNKRKVPFASMGVRSLFIGSRFYAEGRPEDFPGFEFKPGDTLFNPDGENKLVFTSKGWIEKNEI